jgi:hypothetical protein
VREGWSRLGGTWRGSGGEMGYNMPNLACRKPPPNTPSRLSLVRAVKLKSVSEDLLLSAERDDVRMTLPFLY